MTPTGILRHEHELILRVLDRAAAEVQTLEQTGELDAGAVEKMLDFFRNFADRCHHAKEEQQLFVRLQSRGIKAVTGPVNAMLAEHVTGRAFLSRVAAALPAAREGDSTARAEIQEALGGYVTLLRLHIAKENLILFPLADKVLLSTDQAELLTAFERLEAEEMGPGTHERYHHLAEELTAAD